MPPTATGFAALPLRSEKGAPEWDETDRYSVKLYFEQVRQLNLRHQVTDAKEQKDAALLYVPSDVRRLWSTYAEYNDATKTFDDFRDAVLGYYAGDDTNQFTLNEYHALVQATARTGIADFDEYLRFYRRFRPMVNFLTSLTPSRLNEDFASTQLMSLIPKQLLEAVFARLEIVAPNKSVNDIYTVQQVHEAISHVWHERTRRGAYMAIIAPGESLAGRELTPPMAPVVTAPPVLAASAPPVNRSPSPSIKEELDEALAGLKAEILSTLVQGLRGNDAQPGRQGPYQPYAAPGPTYGPSLNQPNYSHPRQPAYPAPDQQQYQRQHSSNYPPPSNLCYYCFQVGCHSTVCRLVDEHIAAGYIQRHPATRRILLPGGGEPPSGPGPMSERVLRWHAEHPGQRAVAQLGHGNNAPPVDQPPPAGSSNQTGPTQGQVHSMLLSVDANLQDVENELTEEEADHALQLAYDLVKNRRGRAKFAGVVIPPPPKRKLRKDGPPSPPPPTEADGAAGEASPGLDEASTTTESPDSDAGDTRDPARLPPHPFQSVPDGSAAGAPKVRDFAYTGQGSSKAVQTEAQPTRDTAPSLPARREPAYRHVLAAHDPQALDRVFERNFGGPPNVQMTTAELINISEPARKRLHAMTSLARFPVLTAPPKPADLPPAAAETVTTLSHNVAEVSSTYHSPTVEDDGEEFYDAAESAPVPAAFIEEVPEPAATGVVESYKVDALPIELRGDGDDTASEHSDDEDDLPPGIYRLDPEAFQSTGGAPAPPVASILVNK